MLRPFIPAKNHDQSKRFYEALGFATEYADDSIAVMSNGIDSFILQNFYEKELADNFMVHSSLGYATPAAFAAELEKQRAGLTPPVASPALMRDNTPRPLVAVG